MRPKHCFAAAVLIASVLPPSASTQAQVQPLKSRSEEIRRCIKCSDDALRLGRDTGAFCSAVCDESIWSEVVCEEGGVNCRPKAQAKARSSVRAGSPIDVPVTEHASDGQMSSCSSSKVAGLDPEGDGFLAVRSGPGTKHRKVAEVHNGDLVYVFEMRGDWAGVVYGRSTVNCASTKTRQVPHRTQGWVHKRFLQPYAG